MVLEANSSEGLSRREGLGGLAGWAALGVADMTRVAAAAGKGDLIDKVTHKMLWPGRREGYSWFHPRVCMIHGAKGPVALMTTQKITGSDYFHAVHWSVSSDLGKFLAVGIA